MNLKIKRILQIVVVSFLVIVSAMLPSHMVEAAYGNLGAYNMPAKMRGTWVSHDKKSLYKKIKITKNTITLTRKHKQKTDGKWHLRKVSQKWKDKTSMRTLIKSHRYAQKHRYMAVRKEYGAYIFNFGWGVPCNDADFNLRSKSKSILHFGNVVHANDFRRVK